MDSSLKIKFWGTRGWISSPRLSTAKYGGNTISMQIIHDDHLIIVDCGFGISNLGEELLPLILKEKKSLHIHIFLSHFHWDHIQGLPFFHPIYFPSSTLNIYSPVKSEVCLKHLDILFDGSYSPFSGIKNMPSKINFIQMTNQIELNNLKITHIPTNHHIQDEKMNSCDTYAYRFQLNEESITIATDHESFNNPINETFIAFAENSSILVHDAHFTAVEYKEKINWGHSSMEQALDNGIRAKAKNILLAHHSPYRDDLEFDTIFQELKNKQKYKGLEFSFARENLVYNAKFKKP